MTVIFNTKNMGGPQPPITKQNKYSSKGKKEMELFAWITAIVVAYLFGRFHVVQQEKKRIAQWKQDCATGTPIGTQLAREMGIEL